MLEDNLNVFAYGTLQPGGRFHDEICGAQQFTASEAWIHGRLFDFPDRGYPAAVEDPHVKVYGCLLQFETAGADILAALDQLEGYNPQAPEADNLYYRTVVDVRLIHGQDRPHTEIVSAWCYFMHAAQVKVYGGIQVDTGRWAQSAAGTC